MPAAPVPENEPGRQKALDAYRIVGTGPNPVFETLVQLAAEICDTPIALISLIDHHQQHLIARHGVDVPQTPREKSLCPHAILSNTITETRDAREDPRFFDSPLVTGPPGIRFYAAQPIATPDGFNIGTICVAAPETRELNDLQRAALLQLSKMTTLLLDARKEALDKEQHLRHMATHDGLTGLPNRVLGMDRLESALARSRRTGLKVALLFIDLNEFKRVNDAYGHAVGDEVLVQIGSRLSTESRETDTVTRWGGDEFLVILSDVTDPTHAHEKMLRLLKVLTGTYKTRDAIVSIGASIGVATYPEDGDGAETLLRYADKAMYRHKYHADAESVSD